VPVPDLANPVFAPILAGAEATLAEHGYAVLVANTPGRDVLHLVDSLLARRAEGLILATARERDPALDRCIGLGVATVLVNRADAAGRVPCAVPDDREGMRLAVRHLLALGHRRIGYLAGPADVSTGRLRAEGFRAAMQNAGLPADTIEEARACTRDAGQDAAGWLLARHRLTAIAAANDLLALGAYGALAARGLCCPGQVSVTGHNDMPLVDMVQPPLTTVRIDQGRIGREGTRRLLARRAAPTAPPAQGCCRRRWWRGAAWRHPRRIDGTPAVLRLTGPRAMRSRWLRAAPAPGSRRCRAGSCRAGHTRSPHACARARRADSPGCHPAVPGQARRC